LFVRGFPRSPKCEARRSRDAEEVPQLKEGWKLVDEARELFREHFPLEALDTTWQDPRRTFSVEDYLSLQLIGLVNPTVKTMRGLCAATHLPRLQRQWGCGPMSLGSVSEAQHLIDPELMRPLIGELNSRVLTVRQQAARSSDPAPPVRSSYDERLNAFDLRATDSTVMAALPRMVWALYGGGRGGCLKNAVRVHVSFDPLSLRPVEFKVSEGRLCERKAWKENHQRAEPQATFIADRYYSKDFGLLDAMVRKGTHFVVRLREADYLRVVEELPLSEADRAEGVVRQAWVELGKRPRQKKKELIRVIWLQRAEGMIILATDYPPDQLPAELASLMYRERWQVEFFFRWIKCLLGCRHWMAESREGVTLQLYLVLIAALLLQLRCGRRPTRRMMELLQFYFQGLASVDDLSLGLEREAAMAEAAAERKKNRRLFC
jgi:hypothetical protein